MERKIKQVPLQKMQAPKLTRVAAYARVSSGKDAMLHSLSAQVSYYTDLIQRHPGWVFCGVYADEALTGTKADRENFTRLLNDCRAGKVDMVITKSISRFARNTVTLLETVRELKQIGVDVYFEEQNIHSISPDGELMLSILASYAQEESLSASASSGISRMGCLGTARCWGIGTRTVHTSSCRRRPKSSVSFLTSICPAKASPPLRRC